MLTGPGKTLDALKRIKFGKEEIIALLVILSLILMMFLVYLLHVAYQAKENLEAATAKIYDLREEINKREDTLVQVRDKLAEAENSLVEADKSINAQRQELKELRGELDGYERQKDLQTACVRKGEGICHVLARQLMASSDSFGFEGDAADKKAVKKWAQTKAYEIACRAGYINIKTGKEVRVAKPGLVAYRLVEDSEGNISVEEYLRAEDGTFPFQPEQVNQLAENIESSQLGQTQAYEYVFRA